MDVSKRDVRALPSVFVSARRNGFAQSACCQGFAHSSSWISLRASNYLGLAKAAFPKGISQSACNKGFAQCVVAAKSLLRIAQGH